MQFYVAQNRFKDFSISELTYLKTILEQVSFYSPIRDTLYNEVMKEWNKKKQLYFGGISSTNG